MNGEKQIFDVTVFLWLTHVPDDGEVGVEYLGVVVGDAPSRLAASSPRGCPPCADVTASRAMKSSTSSGHTPPPALSLMPLLLSLRYRRSR